MSKFEMMRGRLAGTALLLCFAFVLVYFGYQGLYGNHGLIRQMWLSSEAERLAFELSEVQQERELLERRVHLLRPESLDLDMLDERARTVLGYAHKNDLVIMDPTH